VNYHPECVKAAINGQTETICPECLMLAKTAYIAESDSGYDITAHFYSIQAIEDNYITADTTARFYGNTVNPGKSTRWNKTGLKQFS
jgi:hypothetical protein